jgi:hemin uptake protein HemP
MTQSETAGADGQTRASPSQGPASVQVRPLASSELLQGAKSVEISHNGSVYRLQATRLGKLILTK